MRLSPIPGRVEEILAAYDGDPEVGHLMEDDLLWDIVQRVFVVSDGPELRALGRLRAAKRTRWYA